MDAWRVRNYLQSSVGEHCSRRRGGEWSPFDHLGQQSARNFHAFTLGISFYAPLPPIPRATSPKKKVTNLTVTMTRGGRLHSLAAITESAESRV
jgi:hypothetical protein